MDKKLHLDKKCSFRQQTVSQSACWRSMFVFYILKVNNLNQIQVCLSMQPIVQKGKGNSNQHAGGTQILEFVEISAVSRRFLQDLKSKCSEYAVRSGRAYHHLARFVRRYQIGPSRPLPYLRGGAFDQAGQIFGDRLTSADERSQRHCLLQVIIFNQLWCRTYASRTVPPYTGQRARGELFRLLSPRMLQAR